ncbi:MAG: EscU/YscU/HrcU family type III secretion system export apparatus switch protein [Mariprofundaceae bacterium]
MRDRETADSLGLGADSKQSSRGKAVDFDATAKRILELAKEKHLYIHEDENLAQLLAQVPVGQEIPEDAYQLVAELLAFLYQTDQKLAEKINLKAE